MSVTTAASVADRRPGRFGGVDRRPAIRRGVRRYSFRNVVLIAAQCGYSTKKVAGTDPDTGEEVEDRLVRYPVLSMFDIESALYGLCSQPVGRSPVRTTSFAS
jgi:hypothetical protein